MKRHRAPTMTTSIASHEHSSGPVLIARWFIATNSTLDPDVVIPPDDHELGDLLIAAAGGERTDDAKRALLRRRATG